MKKLLTAILLTTVFTSFGQTVDALKIKSAFENLSANTNSKKLQQVYINAFPADTKTFLAVFQSDKFDQLYSDSHKYIDALEKCATTFPTEVISKCVDIGKNLVWDADAVGQLQHISIDIAIKNIATFVGKYKTLNSKEQDKLITFYADIENYNSYPEYQELINKLNSIGEKDIAKNFEAARTVRIKQQLTVPEKSFEQTKNTPTFPIDKQCEQCLDTALTKTSDMMSCFAVARDSWDKEVTKYYNLLMTKLKPEQKEKLISAQKEWTSYKEKEFELCTYIYYNEEQGHEKRIDAISREAQIVRQRALDLMQYYDLYLE